VKDPELDALLDEAAASSDADLRADNYQQAQKIVLDGFYILPLFDQQNHYLLRDDVKGLRALPSVSTPTLYDAWLDR